METRYQEMLRLPEKQHQSGCPVVLEAGALLRDNIKGKLLAQLKLRNLSVRKIVACTVEVRASAVNGEPLEGVTFQYKDLSVGNEESFGAKTPVFLPDANTRRVEVIVREVVQEPFRVWTAGTEDVQPLPEATRLTNVLGDERHIAQYAARVGKPCQFVPEQKQGLFLCTCGKINLIEDGNCASCGRTYEELNRALDPDAIHEEVVEQLRIEEEQRLEAERAAEEARIEAERVAAEAAEARRVRQEAAKKKTAKIAKIAIPAIVAIVAAILITTKLIIPAVEDSNAYKAAAAMQAEGAYLDAEQAFLDMGDYKDSADRAKECRYFHAQALCVSGDYAGAIAVWEELGSYSDSTQRAADALTEWKEADYQAAVALKSSGEFIPAAEAFELLGEYKDSAAQQEDCIELQNEEDYTAAAGAFDACDYAAALAMFEALGDYKDASQRYIATAYAYAGSLYESGSFKEAAEYYAVANGYEDAASRETDAIYHHGCQLYEEGKYADAIKRFQSCADYQDAQKKLLDAKFGFVGANMDPENKTTYKYMKELVDAGYKGAKKVYDELYAWKVEIVAFNNDPNNSSINLSSLSKYQYMCVHFKLTGGEPGAKLNLRTTLTLPNGQSGSIPHPGVSSGYIGCSYGWYNEPAYGSVGTLTFKAYDENNKLLLTATVKVTN